MAIDRNSLRIAATHEWVHLDGDVATVGITDFAVKELTDLVYMELPGTGESFSAGEVFGEVESVKTASDLYAPVAGEVLAVNQELPDHLDWLSTDPFGKGWILKLRVALGTTLDHLLTPEQYDRSH